MPALGTLDLDEVVRPEIADASWSNHRVRLPVPKRELAEYHLLLKPVRPAELLDAVKNAPR